MQRYRTFNAKICLIIFVVEVAICILVPFRRRCLRPFALSDGPFLYPLVEVVKSLVVPFLIIPLLSLFVLLFLWQLVTCLLQA